jgi:hypothetical protein
MVQHRESPTSLPMPLALRWKTSAATAPLYPSRQEAPDASADTVPLAIIRLLVEAQGTLSACGGTGGPVGGGFLKSYGECGIGVLPCRGKRNDAFTAKPT